MKYKWNTDGITLFSGCVFISIIFFSVSDEKHFKEGDSSFRWTSFKVQSTEYSLDSDMFLWLPNMQRRSSLLMVISEYLKFSSAHLIFLFTCPWIIKDGWKTFTKLFVSATYLSSNVIDVSKINHVQLIIFNFSPPQCCPSSGFQMSIQVDDF